VDGLVILRRLSVGIWGVGGGGGAGCCRTVWIAVGEFLWPEVYSWGWEVPWGEASGATVGRGNAARHSRPRNPECGKLLGQLNPGVRADCTHTGFGQQTSPFVRASHIFTPAAAMVGLTSTVQYSKRVCLQQGYLQQ